MITEQRDYLAIISIENEVTSSIVIPCQDKIRIALALSHPFEQVLLLQSHAMSFSNADFKQQLAHLFELNEAQSTSLQLRLSGISHLMAVSDISQSCRHFPASLSDSASDLSLLTNKQILSARLPKPEPLHHHIERKKQRFLINTDISLSDE